MLKLRLVLLPLAAALLLGGCGGMPERTPYRSGTDHLPLLDGRILRYRQNDEGETTEYTLTLRYLGGRAWKVYEAKGDSMPYGALEFTTDGTLVEAATLISMTSLESRKDVSMFTQVWVDEGAEVDSSWIDPTPGTETIVAGYETMIVPAGKFEDCLKMVVTPLPELKDSIEARYQRDESDEVVYLREKEVMEWQTVRWFAHGVGLVKEQIGPAGVPKIVRELVALEAEGRGKVDSLYLKMRK